jgi:hypothetical protein
VRRIKQTGALKGRDRRTVQSTSWFRLLTLQFLWRRTDALPEPFGTDLRAFGPVHVCPCGSQVFNVMASFEDYELVWYFLDATCVNCGNLVTVPCPVDAE